MPIQDYASFKGVKHIGNQHVSNILEANLKMYYDWSMLNIGAWTDIAVSGSSVYGGDFSQLRLVKDPAYDDGQVWESPRKDWVWETGVLYVDATGGGPHSPLSVGTPIINGVPSASPYSVNYELGRIVFHSSIPTNSTVMVEHSYRDVQIYRADDVPWFRELQFHSFRPDHFHFEQIEKGSWSIGSQHRIQMPCIIIEVTPMATSRGFELGNGALVRNQDVVFYVLAEDRFTRNNLVDIVLGQSDKTIWLFDVNTIARENAYPISISGDYIGSGNYSTFVEDYRWRQCRMINAKSTELRSLHPNLYDGVIRTTMEVVLEGLSRCGV